MTNSCFCLQLGRLGLKIGQHEQALTALHRAFVLAPGPEPAYKMAVASHRIGRENEALQWAKEAVVQLAELDEKGAVRFAPHSLAGPRLSER